MEEWHGFWHGRGIVGAQPQQQLVQRQHRPPPPLPQPPPPRSSEPGWLQAAENTAAAGRAWVSLAGDVVVLAFKLLVLGAVAWVLWHGCAFVAAGRAATEQEARDAGRTLDAFLGALSP